MFVEHEYLQKDINILMDISPLLSMPLLISIWISIDLYGYPCMDLRCILNAGEDQIVIRQ